MVNTETLKTLQEVLTELKAYETEIKNTPVYTSEDGSYLTGKEYAARTCIEIVERKIKILESKK